MHSVWKSLPFRCCSALSPFSSLHQKLFRDKNRRLEIDHRLQVWSMFPLTLLFSSFLLPTCQPNYLQLLWKWYHKDIMNLCSLISRLGICVNLTHSLSISTLLFRCLTSLSFCPPLPLRPYFSLSMFIFIFIHLSDYPYPYLRRPFPSGCEDIGTWQAVFQATSVIAVFTNAGLVFYTAEYFGKRLYSYLFIFLFSAYVCCLDSISTRML